MYITKKQLLWMYNYLMAKYIRYWALNYTDKDTRDKLSDIKELYERVKNEDDDRLLFVVQNKLNGNGKL